MTVPALAWLRTYQRQWLRADVAAGITLAAYLLPAALGDATLAGLPPEAGLYACIAAGLVFWIFCSSRHTAPTITSAISLLIGATLGEAAHNDPARMATLAAATALLVAALAFIAYIIRAGAVVSFFSETVLIGFKCGVALYLASTQLPKLFGFAGSHGDFWERMAHFVRNLGSTNPTALAFGTGALAILLLGKTLLRNRPVAIFVVVGGIVAARVFHLDSRGVALLGEVPQGMPLPSLPLVSRTDLQLLFPLSMACFLLASVETNAIGRMFAGKHGHRLDSTQEFLAIGSANLMAGLFRGFPVSGGMSQSVVNETAGARTPLSGLISALLTLSVALFFTGLLRNLPQPVLAAVVVAAVTGLVDITALRRIWQFSRSEFGVAGAALLGVLGAGLLQGVLVGVVLSILLLIGRAARPRVTELGRVPGTTYWADLTRHPENAREPDILVVRAEGSVVYFNADHIHDRVMEIVSGRTPAPRLVIFSMALVPFVDLTGTELIHSLHTSLHARGIDFRIAESRGQVRTALRRAPGGHGLLPVEANQTVDDVLHAWRMTQAAPVETSL